MWSTKAVTNDLQPGHYFVAYQTDQPEDYQTRVRISNGGQNDASTSWGGVTQSGSHVYYEFNVPDDGKPYKVMIYSTPYNVNATKDINISNVYVGKLSDQVGGVSNLALYSNEGIGNNSTFDEHTGVYQISIPANKGGDNYDLWNCWPGKIKSGNRYRVAFDVMGNGNSFGVTFRMIDPIWKIDTIFAKHPVGLEWETITYDYTATYDGSKEAWIKVRNWSIVALD